MRRLRFFRGAFCLSLALGLALNLSKFHEQVSHFRALLGERPLALLPALAPFDSLALRLLDAHWALGGALVVCLLAGALSNRLARPALAASLVLLFFYGGILLSCDWHLARYQSPARIFDLVFPVLLLLLIEPGGDLDGETRLTRFTLLAAQLCLAFVYFGSGVAKVRVGSAWLGGEPLQTYFLWSHFRSGAILPFRLAQNLPLCAALSVLAVVFELAAPILVLFRRGRMAFLVAALVFHLFAELVLGVQFFFPFFAPGFLAFLPEDAATSAWRRFKSFLPAAACLLLCAGVAQAESETYRAPHFECLAPDSRLLLRPKPECEGVAANPDGSSVRYHLNSAGLWDIEHLPAPAKSDIRVLFLGNSLWIPHREGGSVPGFFRDGLPGLPVETVNGSVNGFSLVQSYLFLPELLERYHPRVVLILGNVLGNGLSTFHHHAIAAARDSAGLAKSIGPAPAFWPLPESWSPWLWSRPSAFRWLIYSTVAHELWLLAKRPITGGEPVVEIYERYLEAMVALARAAGAESVIVREDGLDPATKLVMYKPETLTARLWPASIVTPADAEALYQRIGAKGIRVLDLHGLSGAPHGGSFDIPGDIHLTLEGMRAQGLALGEALRPVLAPLGPAGLPGKKRR